MLAPGTPAPDFSLEDENGTLHTLADTKGKTVLLYFYPKDGTPGCTKEACTLRDSYAAYKKAGVVVLGISPDSVESHRKFKEKYSLPFTLLSDSSKETAAAYDAKGLLFTSRISYLIDGDGLILNAFPDVDPATHAEEVLSHVLRP